MSLIDRHWVASKKQNDVTEIIHRDRNVKMSSSVKKARERPERASNRRIAIVGCGALGSEFCRLLAVACDVEVLLIDPDKIEIRNLQYSKMLQMSCNSLFGNSACEEFKGSLLSRAAELLFHRSGWEFLPKEIADASLSAIAKCDLIVSCTDSSLARCETSWIARLLGKGMVDGGLKGEGQGVGRIAWYPPDWSKACYLCEISESRRADVLSYAVSGSLGCAAHPRQMAMDAPPEMVTIIAERMLEVVQSVLNSRFKSNTPPWPHLEDATAWFYPAAEENGPGTNVEAITLTRSVTCPWHETIPPEHLRSADTQIAIREILQRLARHAALSERMVLELHWPICLRARCTACRAESRPMRRLGWVRRHGVCAQCRTAGTLDPLETVQTLTVDSPSAEMTLGDFGFAADDLFCFRPEYS